LRPEKYNFLFFDCIASESSTSIENEQDIKHQILAHDLLDKLPAISLDSKEELSSDSSPNTRILYVTFNQLNKIFIYFVCNVILLSGD
jgi:hypothetical protein